MEISIHSTINRNLKEETLKKGGLIGAFGALLLLGSGIFLPLAFLKIWGIPILICGLLFITVGLRPYRQLTRLELHPHQLIWDGQDIVFFKTGKPLIRIKPEAITSITWQQHQLLYGIAIRLRRPIQLTVCDPYFDAAGFLTDSSERFDGCDLFLPFFSKKSFDEWTFNSGLKQY